MKRLTIKEVFLSPQASSEFIFQALWNNKTKYPLDFLKEQNDCLFYDSDYCLLHSADKKVINILNDIDNFVNNMPKLAILVYNRFGDKWNKLYRSMIAEYLTFEDTFRYEKTSPEITITDSKKGTNTLDTQTNTDITETKIDEDSNDMYGYNVVNGNSVPVDKSESMSTFKTKGDALANNEKSTQVVDNTNTKIKNGTIQHEVNGLEKHTNQELLEQEIKVRKNIFINTVYEDIDKVFCLSIY